jgi:hypothetical protein
MRNTPPAPRHILQLRRPTVYKPQAAMANGFNVSSEQPAPGAQSYQFGVEFSFCTAQGPHIELRMIPIPEEPIKVTIARIDPTRTKNATLVKIEKASWRKRTC